MQWVCFGVASRLANKLSLRDLPQSRLAPWRRCFHPRQRVLLLSLFLFWSTPLQGNDEPRSRGHVSFDALTVARRMTQAGDFSSPELDRCCARGTLENDAAWSMIVGGVSRSSELTRLRRSREASRKKPRRPVRGFLHLPLRRAM